MTDLNPVDAMTTDFRAICTELSGLDGHCVVDCTEEWADAGGFSIRHGIAAVLRHLADTDAQYDVVESWYAVPVQTLEDLADALERQ